jgi:hypothetical protein
LKINKDKEKEEMLEVIENIEERRATSESTTSCVFRGKRSSPVFSGAGSIFLSRYVNEGYKFPFVLLTQADEKAFFEIEVSVPSVVVSLISFSFY